MSEFFQPGQHPDADQLSAFTENALPAHEREQTLAHLASCEDCRTIVSLSLPPVEEIPEPVATRKPWFSIWNFAWPAAAAATAMIALTVHLHRAAPVYAPIQIAATNPPPPLATPAPIPPPPAPKAVTHPNIKSTRLNPPPASPSDNAWISQEAGRAINAQEISNLPLNGRNATPLTQQATSLNKDALHGSLMGKSAPASAGIAPAPNQQITWANGQAAAAPKPLPSTPSQAAAGTEVTVANAAAMQLATTDAATSASITPLKLHELPSHLAIASSITRANQTLALDTAGTLFLSTDEGHHWKAVSPQWSGRAVKIELSSLPLRNRQTIPRRTTDKQTSTQNDAVDDGSTKQAKKAERTSQENNIATPFEIITDTGERWTSLDGLIWSRE